MKINEKVKKLRELHHFSQEEMAEKLNLSTSGYAKIEKGERGLDLHKLERIATVFGIELTDLLEISDNSVVCLINENSHHHNHNHYGNQKLEFMIEKLNLQLEHYCELIKQKDKEIEILNKLITALEAK